MYGYGHNKMDNYWIHDTFHDLLLRNPNLWVFLYLKQQHKQIFQHTL